MFIGSLNCFELALVPVFKTLTHLPPYMGILIGLGIMSIAALQSAGILSVVASWLREILRSDTNIGLSLRILSSLVDNIPLVAAAQGMYNLSAYPTDHTFWEFPAYATGTGGSVLVIGSAAGVAAMGIENISFF